MKFCFIDALFIFHIQAIIAGKDNLAEEHNVRLVTVFDHEEVGSATFVGADSCVLHDLITRIMTAVKLTEKKEDTYECKGQGLAVTIRKSFCVSVDNAHAVHPNYAFHHEDNHKPLLNKGPVIKYNAKQVVLFPHEKDFFFLPRLLFFFFTLCSMYEQYRRTTRSINIDPLSSLLCSASSQQRAS